MITMLNKYVIEFLKAKFRDLIRYFSVDIEASKIAKITRISRVIINKIIKSVSYTTIQFSNLDENIIYNEKSYTG